LFKNVFVIAVCVVGAVEWIKKLLPEKANENKVLLATISGVISVIGSVLFVAFGQTIGLVAELDNTNWVNYVIYSGATVGLVQVSYTALLKTFKAVVEKLKGKYANPTIDEDKLSDEIVETIEEKVTEAVSDAIKTTTSTKKK
jgi:hypothetical protein